MLARVPHDGKYRQILLTSRSLIPLPRNPATGNTSRPTLLVCPELGINQGSGLGFSRFWHTNTYASGCLNPRRASHDTYHVTSRRHAQNRQKWGSRRTAWVAGTSPVCHTRQARIWENAMGRRGPETGTCPKLRKIRGHRTRLWPPPAPGLRGGRTGVGPDLWHQMQIAEFSLILLLEASRQYPKSFYNLPFLSDFPAKRAAQGVTLLCKVSPDFRARWVLGWVFFPILLCSIILVHPQVYPTKTTFKFTEQCIRKSDFLFKLQLPLPAALVSRRLFVC